MKVVCGVKVGNMKDSDEAKRGRVGVVDFPVRELGPEEVKIKVAYCRRSFWAGTPIWTGA